MRFAARPLIVGVEAVGVPALERWFGVSMRLGLVGFAGVPRRCAGTCVVFVEAEGFHPISQRLLPGSSCIALGLDLGLALPVGGLSFLEDIDDVLALRA